MKSRIPQQPLVRSCSNLKLNQKGSNQSVQRYEMKMTSNGRWPENMKSRISQQPLIGSYSNWKLNLLGSNQSVRRYEEKTTSNGRRPPMDDDLKIWKVEYLSNHWSDLTYLQKYQIKKLGKLQYFSNSKLNLMGSNQSVHRDEEKTTSNERRPLTEYDLQQKTTSKYEKLNISATTGQILLIYKDIT
jgi:hypothetical protein